MKHLKIYFAVLFFTFLINGTSKLWAQGKDLGKWTRSMQTGDYLSNGEYRLTLGEAGNDFFVLTKNDEIIWRATPDINLETLNEKTLKLVTSEHGTIKIVPNSANLRQNHTTLWWPPYGTFADVDFSAYIWLADNGNIEIYPKSGILGLNSGKPVWASGTCGGIISGCGNEGKRN
jgi:hypothetical protein